MRSVILLNKFFFRKYFILQLALLLTVQVHSQQYTKVEVENGKVVLMRDIKTPIDSTELYKLSSRQLKAEIFNDKGHRDTIQMLGAINVSLITSGSNCDQYDGSLIASASGGVKPYFYSVDGSFKQRNGVFFGLKTGSHSLVVTDSIGASVSIPFTIGASFSPPVIGVDSTVNNTGCLTSDGKIFLNATGGQPPYLFSQEDGAFQANNTFTNLKPGDYTFTVKDANGCTASTRSLFYGGFAPTGCSERFGIMYPHFACEVQGYLGTVTLDAGGSKPPYTFSLDGVNFQSSGVFTGLVPNEYNAYYKDGTGGTWWFRFRIREQCPPALLSTGTEAACQLSTGTLTINPILGLPPYQYSLDGVNFQTTPTFTNLPEGFYALLVKDRNGERFTGYGYVPKLCPEVIATYRHPGCKNNDGVVTGIPYKGTPPFSYSLDGINFQSSPIFSGLAEGNYTLSMKDSLGGIGVTYIQMVKSCIRMNIRVDTALCGKPTGSITVQALDGIEPYQYSIDGGIHFQLLGFFDKLTPGSYTVTVMDNSGRQSSENVIVPNFNDLKLQGTTTPSSCNDSVGSISLQASGGIQPYTYSIDSIFFQASARFNSLASREYTLFVKDTQGCIGTTHATVGLINTLDLKVGDDKVICESKSVELDLSSNASSYSWFPAAGLSNVNVKNPIATPNKTTTYIVTSTLGLCSKVDSVIVNVLAAPKPNAGKDTLICYGQDARLNGTGGVQYHWNPSTHLENAFAASVLAKSLTASQAYYLSVVDDKGCTSLADDTVIITVTPPVSLFIGNDTTILLNQPFQLNVTDRNASGFVSFIWSPSSGLTDPFIRNPIATISQNTRYTLSVKTAAGCEGSDDVYLKVMKGPEIYMPNAFTPNGDGKNDVIRPILIGISVLKNFAIYNRWGQIVFSSTDASKGWDGKVNGISQPTSSFSWRAEGIDINGNKILRQGVLTLIR